jgi:hypothetical protein
MARQAIIWPAQRYRAMAASEKKASAYKPQAQAVTWQARSEAPYQHSQAEAKKEPLWRVAVIVAVFMALILV